MYFLNPFKAEGILLSVLPVFSLICDRVFDVGVSTAA